MICWSVLLGGDREGASSRLEKVLGPELRDKLSERDTSIHELIDDIRNN